MITARVVEVRLEVRCDGCQRTTRTLSMNLAPERATKENVASAVAELEEQAVSAAQRLRLLGEKKRHICPACENSLAPVLA